MLNVEVAVLANFGDNLNDLWKKYNSVVQEIIKELINLKNNIQRASRLAKELDGLKNKIKESLTKI